jgi:3-oxoacyl-[acyl-carrier protein] reductase
MVRSGGRPGVNLGLTGRRVLVSGASRGIGLAIARAFLAEGADVGLTARGAEGLDAAREELAAAYPQRRVVAVAGDMRDPAAVDHCVSEVSAALGGLDVVVANVGRGRGPVDDAPGPAAWREMLDENLLTAVHVSEAAVSELSEDGALLLVGSIAGLEFHPAPLPYSTAKAALVRYTRDLARRLGRRGVRVNMVAPGNVLVRGGSWDERRQQDPEGVRDLLATDVPMNRFGTPEEIAAGAVFLCSPRSSFTTGACLVIDGGQLRA